MSKAKNHKKCNHCGERENLAYYLVNLAGYVECVPCGARGPTRGPIPTISAATTAEDMAWQLWDTRAPITKKDAP